MRAQTTLGAAAVLLLAAAAYTSLFASPPDAFQGEYVRIMYAHVPNAWVAYLAFAITFVASVLTCGNGARIAITLRTAPPSSACCSPGWRWPPARSGGARYGGRGGRGTPAW